MRATRAPRTRATADSSADSDVFHGAASVRRAVRRAARARLEEGRLGVRHADDQHAVMQQRQLHAEQRALLSAMRRGARREHACGFVGEPPRQPQLARRVEKVLERRRHVAEARGAAEQQAVGFREIAELDVRRAVRGHGWQIAGRGGGNRRHGAQPRHGARALDAARGLACERGGAAASRVVKNEDRVVT